MFAFVALLAALTISGAFWVVVLAARRLRDWGDARALEEGQSPLALPGAHGPVPDDPRTRKIRTLVAQRLKHDRALIPSEPAPRISLDADDESGSGLSLDNLRIDDVVSIDAADSWLDGDYVVEAMMHLREGGQTSVVAMMQDASRKRWLVGSSATTEWMLVEPVHGHGLSGEPPRHIHRPSGSFSLLRRGQASAACTGSHGRPELARVATYAYTAGGRDALWLERWDDQVFMAEGKLVARTDISFLPGS